MKAPELLLVSDIMADQEVSLEQTGGPEVNFDGVTLTITSNSNANENEKEGLVETPRSGNVSPRSIQGQPEAKPLPSFIQAGFFAGKRGRLEEAVSVCQSSVVDTQNDGTVQGVWLLTEVDHWDNEKEKIVILTQKSLLNVKYDFVAGKIKDCKRVLFKDIDYVQKGLFEYPERTFVEPRNGYGFRVHWGKGRELSFFERWNPYSSSVPYMTFVNHPLEPAQEQASSYQAEAFLTALVQGVNVHRQEQNASSPSLPVKESPIQTDILVGWHSSIYNQSRLGFSRERGGVSF